MVTELYPFESRSADVAGLRMNYVDEGVGETVVMVHGNPTWSFYYRNLINALKGSCRVIAPDHIGCGRSEKPDATRYPFTLQRRIDDLEALLDTVGLTERLTLVVHDWGGMIAMGYATRHPERISRLVVLNTCAFHMPKTKIFPWPLWLGRDTGAGAFLIQRANLFSRAANRVCVNQPMAPAVRAGYLEPYDSPQNRLAVLRFVQDIPLRPGDTSYDTISEIQDRLDTLQHLPMLICWGDKDWVFDRHFLREWQARFSDSEVETYPGAGHYVLEDAREQVIDRVQRFLQEHPLDHVARPLPTPEATVNVATHLETMARQQPDHKAVIVPKGRDARGHVAYTHYTCAQLNAECDRIAHGLRRIGVQRGMRTVLMVTPSLDFFALTFALFKLGAVPVLVDPGMGVANLGKCLEEAQPEAFVGIPKAHVARLVKGWSRSTLKILVTVGRRFFWGGSTLSELRRGSPDVFHTAPTDAQETAAILFTSGSTGVPKGAVYSHGIFAAQVDFLRDVYGIEPGEIDLATFPLFALFGPALGMTVLVPDMDASRPASADPAGLAQTIKDFDATTMFGSPALVNNLARHAIKNDLRFPSLRRVICAGAPCPPRVLEQFSRLLSGDAQVWTPYGATESLPVCSIGSRELLADTRARTEAGEGVCVGKPVPKMSVRIIGISEEPIDTWSDDLLVPQGEIGEIVVGGPVVTSEYYNRPRSTALAKIRDPQTGDVLHRMGDVGKFDDRGRLWFCGRKAHRVQSATETWFTIPCEGVFNAHPKVFRSALVDVGGKPALCVELEPPATWSTQLEAELRALGQSHAHTRAIADFLVHPDFPVDARHNAKIFREKLSDWARSKLK